MTFETIADSDDSAAVDLNNSELIRSPNEYLDADTWERFNLKQRFRTHLMHNIAQQITHDTGDSFVLKGGTALMLAYGLPRFSTDLDFDSKQPDIDITASLHRGAAKAGVVESKANRKKDTDVKQRHMLRYAGSESDPLKIEISCRQANKINETDIVEIDGMRVYKIEKLAELKTAAFCGRLKSRDIFDVEFLLSNYPDAVSDDTLLAIQQRAQEFDINYLANIMMEDFIIREYDVDSIVLRLVDRVNELTKQRKL